MKSKFKVGDWVIVDPRHRGMLHGRNWELRNSLSRVIGYANPDASQLIRLETELNPKVWHEGWFIIDKEATIRGVISDVLSEP